MSLLEVHDVAKHYGPVVALRSADLVVEAGEIHALMGANGAGKSTLVKILCGVIEHDGGSLEVDGSPVRAASPAAARRFGLAPVFQDPALVPDLTVAQNLVLTGTPAAAVRVRLRQMDLDVDFDALVGELALPTLRMLDLARAMAHDPRLLILDEITAALPSDLAERVFAVMREWRAAGHAVLFITHRLAEVTALCDRATVLRDGRTVGTLAPRRGEEERIVELMLGESQKKIAAQVDAIRTSERGEPKLEVRGLRVGEAGAGVSFTLHAGEILGIAALEGQGQDDLFAMLAGDKRVAEGEISVDGRPLKARTPYDAIRAGMVLVPADRLYALLPQRPIRENLAAPLFNRLARWGPINLRSERARVGRAIDRLEIDTRAQRQARRLSGGNQQKLTIGRWLAAGFEIMLCYDPTRGIDVGTKRQIYALLRELAEQGAAVLLFTSELPEIPLVCDRVLALYRGGITAELPAAEADEPALLRAAHGLTRVAEAAA